MPIPTAQLHTVLHMYDCVLMFFMCTAVFDGHGGSSSASWLQQHLEKDVLARLDQSFLQPDPAAQEVPGRPAVVRPSKLEQTMIEVFQQADRELLQHLLGEKWTGYLCQQCTRGGQTQGMS